MLQSGFKRFKHHFSHQNLQFFGEFRPNFSEIQTKLPEIFVHPVPVPTFRLVENDMKVVQNEPAKVPFHEVLMGPIDGLKSIPCLLDIPKKNQQVMPMPLKY